MKLQNTIIAIIVLLISQVKAQDTLLQISTTGPNKAKCKMATKDVGYGISGLYDIIKTTDGGKTWAKKYSLQFGGAYSFESLVVLDENTVIGGLNSGGRTYQTTNGGDNWTQVLVGKNKRVSSFYFDNPSTGYVVLNGNSGGVDTPYVYKTLDAGKTWEYYSHVKGKGYNAAISMFGSKACMIADSIFYSSDYGITWTTAAFETNSHPLKVHYLNDTSLFVSDQSYLYVSKDGGLSWIQKPRYPNVYKLGDLQFFGNKGYLTTYYSSSYDARIYEITHNGDSLKLIAVEPDSYGRYLAGVFDSTLYFHSDNGRFYTLNTTLISTGVSSPETVSYLLYPNPTSGSVFVSSQNTILSFELLNLNGQIIDSSILNEIGIVKLSLDAQLPEGTYFLRLNFINGLSKTEVIVKY